MPNRTLISALTETTFNYGMFNKIQADVRDEPTNPFCAT